MLPMLPPDDQAPDAGGEAMSSAQTQRPEPVKDPLDDETFAAAVRQLIEDARRHMDDDIRPATERGWRYYNGEVDAEPANALFDDQGQAVYEGSRVVIRECWDRTQQMLPEIARVFLSSDEAVSYIPQTEDDEAKVEQATDYANYVWKVLNDGENLLMDSVLDWSIKFSALKFYWKVDKRTTTEPIVGWDAATLEYAKQRLTPDDEMVANPRPVMIETMVQGPDGQWVPQIVHDYVFDGYITKLVDDRSKHCIEAIPHDEFLIDPYSQSRDEPLLIGSDSWRKVSDIVAMGLDFDEVMEYRTSAPDSRGAQNWGRRTRSEQTGQPATGDSALDYVRVVEAIVQIDQNGDGVAERYRVTCLGDDYKLIEARPAVDCGYIVGSPFRVPHEPIGKGIVEQLTDLQDIKTSLVRDSLNNFRRANHPREVVADSDTNAYADVKSWYGGPIRCEDPAKLGFHTVPYVGDKAFMYLQYFEDIGAKRTGISDAGSGLDPDIMKGQTAEGAHAVVAAPQARMEYLVREYAIQIMRPLFKGILKLSSQYQNKPVVARLRNKWVTVDPSSWNAEMDAAPRVGLGTGTRGERMQGLMLLMAKQEQMMATGSPLVDMQGYRQSLTELCELLGRKDNARYFKELTDEELKAHAEAMKQQAQQAQMEAAQMQAMVEGAKAKASAEAKAQADIAKAQIDGQLAAQKLQADAALAQAKIEAESALQERTHAANIQWQREDRVMALEIQREQMQQQYEIEMAKLAQQRELKLKELEIEQELERARISRKASSGDGNIAQVAN